MVAVEDNAYVALCADTEYESAGDCRGAGGPDRRQLNDDALLSVTPLLFAANPYTGLIILTCHRNGRLCATRSCWCS